MTDIIPHRPPGNGRMAILAGMLLALGACGSDPVESAGSATPAQTAQAQAAPGAGAPVEERLSTADCRQPADGRVFFSLGQTVLAVPGESVREVLPPNIAPGSQASEVIERLKRETAEGAGCPETPLQAQLVTVAAGGVHPLLAGEIGLLAAPPGAITGSFSEVTREIRRNPNQNCQTLAGDLIACAGTERVGERTTNVMYVVSRDPNRNLVSGGPLAVRCLLAEQGVRGCNLVDELPGGIAIDAPLKAGTFSTESLAEAHAAVVGAVNALRR